MSISLTIFLLFFAACIAILLKQVIWSSELTHQLLAIGLANALLAGSIIKETETPSINRVNDLGVNLTKLKL